MERIWTYRGRRLKQLEWGLWRDLDRPGWFFLCYRPAGRRGPVIRRWAYADDVELKADDLRTHVRAERANIQRRKLGIPRRLLATDSQAEYEQQLERRGRTPGSIRDVRQVITRFLEASGIETLEGISVQSLERWLARLSEEGAAPRTQNRHRSHLRAWLEWARRRGQIERNPTDAVEPAAETRRLPVFPSPEEMTALVDAGMKQPEVRPFIACWTFLALTGLRRGSFLSLSLDCFSDEGIRVPHTKRGLEWFIGYGAGCPLWQPDLTELGRRIWRDGPPDGEAMSDRLAETSAELGKRLTCPSLRHAFASWLVSAGEAMSDVAAWCHHTTVLTTEAYYVHLRPQGKVQMAKNQDRVLTMRSQCMAKALAL
jgi:integrase